MAREIVPPNGSSLSLSPRRVKNPTGIDGLFTSGVERPVVDETRVAVTVDGERYVGTVVAETYTPKKADPVLSIELDRPLPDGRRRYAVGPDEVTVI
jgi:hypothetical protein